MAELKLLKKPAEPPNQYLLENIDRLRARVASGEVKGAIVIFGTDTQYEHFWSGLSCESALGLLARVTYKLNQWWDRP